MTRLKKWEVYDFIFVVVIGTLLHFAYDFFNEKAIVGIFAPINESVWEHLKLIFFPSLLFAVAEYIAIGKEYKGFFTVKAISILIGMVSVVALFYTYSGIIGRNFLVADIAVFIVSAIIVSYVSYKYLPKEQCNNSIGILLVILISLCFFIFTSYPFDIGIFKKP